MSGSLCLHAGARIVEPKVLRVVHTPEPTATWTPVPHFTLVNSVRDALASNGVRVIKEEHTLYRDGTRYFGLLHLGDNTGSGNTVIGIHNSHDKAFPVGLSLGNREFVCDNLSFSKDVTVFRKHTQFISRDLDRLVFAAVRRLTDLKERQSTRFAAYRNYGLTNPEAHDLIIRALLAHVISGAAVAKVVAGWREPMYVEFRIRNVWSLFNCFTAALKGINLIAVLYRTMTLQGLLDAYCQIRD